MKDLQEAIGYTFHDPALLTEAMTHSSYAHEQHKNMKYNERLEFLGDAVLSIVVSDYIYDQTKSILPQITSVETVESPKFLDAPEVSFSIVIPDSLGNKQEIIYDGPVEGIEKVGEIIKTMTNGNESEPDNDDTKK